MESWSAQEAQALDLYPGDLISRPGEGPGYEHFGVYLGAEICGHFGSQWVYDNMKGQGDRVVSLHEFSLGKPIRVISTAHNDRALTLARALQKIQKPSPWKLVSYNCEHGAREVVEGRPYSIQLQAAVGVSCLMFALMWISSS